MGNAHAPCGLVTNMELLDWVLDSASLLFGPDCTFVSVIPTKRAVVSFFIAQEGIFISDPHTLVKALVDSLSLPVECECKRLLQMV